MSDYFIMKFYCEVLSDVSERKKEEKNFNPGENVTCFNLPSRYL